MLSQQMNVKFITDQPEDFIGKMISGAKTEEIKKRMDEIRSSLYAVNMVSLAEAVAYQQIGEMEASVKSIQYYGAFIKENYLAEPRLVERLDMIDPSEKNYWSINVPEIEKKINMLPCMNEVLLTTEDK